MVAQLRGCEGFPLGTCVVFLADPSRALCQYCQRSKELADGGPVHVGKLLAEQGYSAEHCRCGGVDDGPMHGQSLLHLRFLGDGPENARRFDIKGPHVSVVSPDLYHRPRQ